MPAGVTPAHATNLLCFDSGGHGTVLRFIVEQRVQLS